MPAYVISFILGLTAVCLAEPAALPSGPIPGQFGVNIHFTQPRPGEMDMLTAAGFRWVRMDLVWTATERQQGAYDFSHYDALIAELDGRQVRAILILDYSNPLYDQGLSPHTEQGRAAFAAWATAAVRHLKGHGILWEMYNEPNGGFWKPKANVEEYARLAVAVGKALRDAAPQETYVGPATSGVDHKFLESCFKAGCLDYWSAVSVHPYRQNEPESSAKDYQTLRALIAKYAPSGKHIPIIAGEWGYSSAWRDFTEERQGKYLSRELLCNLWQEVPLSIWYDWHEDGMEPKEPEHHFGTVSHVYRKEQRPVYQPEPAYLAMQSLTAQLEGFRYNKRLALGGSEDFILLFDRAAKPNVSGDRSKTASEVRLAVWTTAKDPHAVTIPANPGRFTVIGYTGDTLPSLGANENGLSVMLTDSVQYLTPQKPNDLLATAAGWERVALELPVHGPGKAKLQIGGPDIDIGRSPEEIPVRIFCSVKGAEGFAQRTMLVVTNPLRLALQPRPGRAISVRLQNPSGEAFVGRVVLTDPKGVPLNSVEQPVDFKNGQLETTLRFPKMGEAADMQEAGALVLQDGKVVLTAASQAFVPMPDFARDSKDGQTTDFGIYADGNSKVGGETSLSVASPAEGAPEPGMGCLKLTCSFAAGWRFLELIPTRQNLKPIPGKPKAFGLWVYGDGGGGATRIRYIDSTGQTFQAAGESVIWMGWHYLTFAMSGNVSTTSHWGGANDGIVHYPIHWDAMFLLDKPAVNEPFKAQVYVSGATLER